MQIYLLKILIEDDSSIFTGDNALIKLMDIGANYKKTLSQPENKIGVASERDIAEYKKLSIELENKEKERQNLGRKLKDKMNRLRCDMKFCKNKGKSKDLLNKLTDIK